MTAEDEIGEPLGHEP